MISNMKFNSIDELQEWLEENDRSMSDLTVSENIATSGYAHVGDFDQYDTDTITTTGGNIDIDTTGTIFTENFIPKNVAIKSLSVQPNIKQVPLSESNEFDNIWYVDEYESVEDACCGTSKIVYKGSTMFMNVCESNGNSTVTLIAEVDGNIVCLPFKLDTYCNNDTECDMILAI